MVIWAVGWPNESLALPACPCSHSSSRGYGASCWQTMKQSSSSTKYFRTSRSNHFKSPFSNAPPFSFFSSSKGEKRSPRTRERRSVPILILQHCPCKPNSRFPGGLESSRKVVFTGFSGLHQQRFLPIMVFLGQVFTFLILRAYTGN